MEVSSMFDDICTYCIFTLYRRTYPMTFAADACCINTGKGRFKSGALGSETKQILSQALYITSSMTSILKEGAGFYDERFHN